MLNILKLKLGEQPEKRADIAHSYKRPPSISEKLRWADYDKTSKCFYLDDGLSVGAVFELSDVASEARPENYLNQLQRGFQSIFQDVFPLYFDEESPWIIQFYFQDELSLKSFYQSCEAYVKPAAKESQFSQEYLRTLKEHTDLITQPQGLFVDTKVSGTTFRGKYRKIRVVIYRHLTGFSKVRRGRTAAQDLNTVAQTFVSKLEACGIKVKRCEGRDFYNWMVRWFNPSPRKGNGNLDNILEHCPYPEDDAMPYGYDFSERLFFSIPESDQAKGVWYFDNQPHKYMPILGLSTLPQTGHLSLERKFGNFYYGLFDRFPEGSVFALTIVMQNQETVKNHIFRIENSTRRATSTEAEMAREDCALAKRAIESGNYFFPTSMGVYIRGNDLDDLYDKETEVETLLSSNGFIHLTGDSELIPIDSYLRYLPMCYSYHFDKKYLLRSRYLSGKQLSQILPLYGRERGTGHPLLNFYNRCGEPLTLDPFNPKDKDFNSHLLLLGTTGSGKSALSVYLLMLVMAIYRPRLVICDAGNSFGLLSEYFKAFGLTVNRVEISFNHPVSLNPFANSHKMLEQIDAKERKGFTDDIEFFKTQEEVLDAEFISLNQEATLAEKTSEENRDYLGEMLVAAQLMITGGEKKETDAITRQDKFWIMKALVSAAQKAKADGKSQMIASDLIDALLLMAEDLEQTGKKSDQVMVKRLKKMAANLNLFCQDNLSSRYFNTEGQPWPEADVTVLEMGLFKDEGCEAQRALAFMGIMNKTISLAEKHQYDERFTLFFADECHVVTSNPLTALSVTKCAKMSRKIGLWLWFATQNVKDFPDNARKMLSMMETWICLGMSIEELAEVERFKSISQEERLLFQSVRKEAKKYVEGIILCNKFKGLFRNVLPFLTLALAMTEKHEKAERQKIMQELGCTEIEAAIRIAQQMKVQASVSS